MATTTDVNAGVRLIALDRIRHDSNVRDLELEKVDALAGSISLLGQITPAIVRPDGDGYVLVAGHKRSAALQKLGHTEIRAEIRSQDAEHSERAAENIVRSQLNPYNRALSRWMHHSDARLTRSPVASGRWPLERRDWIEREYRC